MTIPNMNLSEARTESIDAGGYVMRVVAAIMDPKYNRLQLQLDIVEGDKAGYYKKLYDKAGFWGMILNLYLDRENAWKFVRAIDALKASNEDFVWNDDGENDEMTLVGKYIGVVTRKVEYMGNDGVVKRKLRPYSTISVQDIRNKNYTVPEMLPLQGAGNSAPVGVVDTTLDPTPNFGPLSDNDTPF